MLNHQNEHFVRGFRRFQPPVTKCHPCHGICTLFPFRAALTLRFAKKQRHDTSKVLRLPRKMNWEISKVLRLPREMQRIFWQKYCAYHTKRPLSRHATCWNVTKCHTCHAKWRYATLESSKSDPFCRTYHRHGHMVLTRTVANGCERLRNVWRTQLNPHTPRVKREPLLRIRDKGNKCQSPPAGPAAPQRGAKLHHKRSISSMKKKALQISPKTTKICSFVEKTKLLWHIVERSRNILGIYNLI